MAQLENFVHRVGGMLLQFWRRGFDDDDRRRAIDRRARLIFHAIMTEHCAECLAPVTLCRQAH